MADLLVTDIDDTLWERFVALAERQGKSAEELMHELIVDYAGDWESPSDVVGGVDSESRTKALPRG